MRKVGNLLILSLFLFTYLGFASQFHFSFPTSKLNYFNYLSEAFLQGKTYLVSQPPSTRDLTFYQDKIYIFWSPVIALIIMPLIAIFGINLSDILYTAFFGALNCYFFYLVINQLCKTKLIKLDKRGVILTTFFFAYGTVHFYLSLFGRVWFTSQVISLTFFLLALLSSLKYLNSQKKSLLTLAFAGFFYALASLNRSTFVLSFPFFIAILYLKNCRPAKLHLAIFFSFFILLSFLFLFYNYFRFGSFVQLGWAHHHSQFTLDTRFKKDFEKFGLFNLAYLPRNFYYNFLNPLLFRPGFPFIKPDPEGNGLFFTSPLFIYLFWMNKKFFANWRLKILNLSIILASLLMLIPAMLNIGSGWYQFGARYLLDIIPFLIILTIQASKNFKSGISLLLLTISCFINIMAYFWWKGLNI